MRIEDVLVWMIVAVTWAPAHRAAWRASPATLASLLVLDCVLLFGAAFVLWSERAWVRVAQEDGVVEWATVFAFVTAAWLSFAGAREARANGRGASIARILVGLFCLFVAGEELSWGQRLFAFEPPELFLARNAQQELNIHNVLMDGGGIGVGVELSLGVAATAIGFGVLAPLLCAAPRLAWARDVFPALALAPIFLAVFALEMSYRVELVGEGAELLLALGFVAVHAARADVRRALLLLGLPLLLGLAVAPAVSRARTADDGARTEAALAELSQLAQDAGTGQRDLLDRKKLVHKRLFAAVGDGYLNVEGGAFLEGRSSPPHDAENPRRDRRGYYLDPWNNPYWLFWTWESRELLLYSFGPNRQRDTDFKAQRAARGDDLVVAVPRARALPPD